MKLQVVRVREIVDRTVVEADDVFQAMQAAPHAERELVSERMVRLEVLDEGGRSLGIYEATQSLGRRAGNSG